MRVAFSVVAVAFFVAGSVAGCAAREDCFKTEPEYGGGGTDEAWRTMVDARGRAEGGADAATLVVPAADSTVAAGTPLQWQSPLKLSSSMPMPMPMPMPGPARSRATGFQRGLRDAVNDAFALVVPAAHAHLPPVTSDVHLIDLLVPGRTCSLQVLTTELTHSLSAESWDDLVEADGEITLELTSAFLTEGRVTEGPFAAAAVTFRVE
jgi:hypothetical protein